MISNDKGGPFEFTKPTPEMMRNVFSEKTPSEQAAEKDRKYRQLQGGTAEQLCRVEDKLDRILSILEEIK